MPGPPRREGTRCVNRILLVLGLACAGAASTADAVEPRSSATPPRLAFASVRIDAVPTESRYRVARVRVSPVESAGELREGAGYALIGRFAKAAGAGCAGDSSIFRNGFEGNP
jgi:hypothetical protein